MVVGGTIFFLWYWTDQCQIRYAEAVLEAFITDVSVDGNITPEEYETMIRNLDKINPKYAVEIRCMEYVVQPVYGLISKERLKEEFRQRNVIQEEKVPEYQGVVLQEDADALCLQTESNETLLAAVSKEWLPLPDEEQEWNVKPVRPYQEVYEGEKLITLCRVYSKEGIYYAEAEEIKAYDTGTVYLQLAAEGKEHAVPVDVVCHPRMVQCNNGHSVVNSVTVLEESRAKGKIVCPFCAIYPELLECNTSLLQKKTGQTLTKEDILITVTYMDGHNEIITPENAEWKDSYDGNFCGIQQVTVDYLGKEGEVTVISENGVCRECGNDCNDRCYADYESFPYCADCMSNVPMFSGEIYEEERWLSTNELVASLDESGVYTLQKGDMITVFLHKGKKYKTLLYKKVLQNGKER